MLVGSGQRTADSSWLLPSKPSARADLARSSMSRLQTPDPDPDQHSIPDLKLPHHYSVPYDVHNLLFRHLRTLDSAPVFQVHLVHDTADTRPYLTLVLPPLTSAFLLPTDPVVTVPTHAHDTPSRLRSQPHTSTLHLESHHACSTAHPDRWNSRQYGTRRPNVHQHTPTARCGRCRISRGPMVDE